MGAYGAALHAKSLGLSKTNLISPEELAEFTHSSRSVICRGCGNKCHLTINTFRGKEKYISGNKCDEATEEMSANIQKERRVPNIHQFKRDKLQSLETGDGKRATIGFPLALGMYELAPFWHAIFSALDFKVLLSGFSSREIYAKGQYSIPSDTACYPAKLMHGHIEHLLEQGVDAIFYPCLTYNFDEGISTNTIMPVLHTIRKCLSANMESLKKTKFLFPYLNINDKKNWPRRSSICFVRITRT
jgi:predicted nucleotide-binding protein (sugar kinase/HSP70/actin superfamily)